MRTELVSHIKTTLFRFRRILPKNFLLSNKKYSEKIFFLNSSRGNILAKFI
jgi:hypothetical protein